MQIASSNHRVNWAHLLLTAGLSVAALAFEPPWVTSLKSDQGRRIFLTQAIGENLRLQHLCVRQSTDQIEYDRLLNDIVYRRIVAVRDITAVTRNQFMQERRSASQPRGYTSRKENTDP
jgi:hypothetical protein